MNFDYEKFSRINWDRCVDPKGFNDPEIGVLYLAVCLGEEAGEIQGIIKKLHRGFNERERKKAIKNWVKANHGEGAAIPASAIPDDLVIEGYWRSILLEKLAKEMADLFIYLNLLETKTGVDLRQQVVEKFNQVSKEMNCPQFTYTEKEQLPNDY